MRSEAHVELASGTPQTLRDDQAADAVAGTEAAQHTHVAARQVVAVEVEGDDRTGRRRVGVACRG